MKLVEPKKEQPASAAITCPAGFLASGMACGIKASGADDLALIICPNGADAAAGVINNLVSRTYVGRGVTLKGSMTQHGGANEFNATIFEGRKYGKTHVSVSLDYFHRDALAASDRSWAKNSDLRQSRALPAPSSGPEAPAIRARERLA